MTDGTGLSPISDVDWPEDIADLLPGFAGALNVYRTMAHHPALLRAWCDLREHVVNQTALGRQRAEIVILRTGVRLASEYEWSQHVLRARSFGLDDTRIASIGGEVDGMAAEDAILAQAVDDLFDVKRLSRQNRDALTALAGVHGVLDLMATVGFYSTLGFILNSFAVPLDADAGLALEKAPLKSL
ncbi:carboxymuconolactone decarboxylase family protein [Sedimentitalea sp. JM2-8]|uniref:Carboxymuconolactone decarboxylase family protein n=1 Tax=Sedimentitalea xiamensis TaxID=3050037 RepID=A0ABT7FKL6_9RHOB|nr:carboxymuconolactone decarboxylase family protein [Sedimentitalea xiamensis]MDK3075299.1 carboxymuconolactone decarboxylase family protein [Sedimentitalea xiamensis]